ncbi:MAG: hypothetical protein LBC63_00335 [Holophagales bacterium]|jgi:hypothetical protein|nr:hypothetical protein [Holophagales bacterium]
MRPAASLLIAPIAIIALATACRLPERHDFSTRIEERTLELKPGGQFHAVTFNGSIDLEGWDRDEVQLVAKIREYREGDVRLTAESKGGRVTIKAERERKAEPERERQHWEIYENRRKSMFGNFLDLEGGASFTVKIPRKAMVTLYSSNGRIEIRRVNGEIDANTTNASIVANDLGAKVRLTTSNGAISATEIKGELFSRTSNGSIDVYDIAGEADIRTSNGRINARNVSGKTEATTSNASISVEEIGAVARLTTSNGSISATRIKGDLFTRTTNSSLDINDISGEADLRTSNGRVKARNIKGKTGVFTSNGSIIAENIENDLFIKNNTGQLEIINVLGSIDAETTNASIMASNLDGKGRGIRLATSNGGITLDLGRAQGTLQAKASEGKAINIEVPNAKPQWGANNVVSAKIGNSEQLIDLRTTHGRITVR